MGNVDNSHFCGEILTEKTINKPPRQRVRNAAGWLVFMIEKTKEQSTNLCAAPYKSRSFSILYLLYTHSMRISRIFSENEKSGMEHSCAPLPTKAIAFQFCRYYTFILRNCQDMNFVRRIKRNPRPAFLPAWGYRNIIYRHSLSCGRFHRVFLAHRY